MPNVDIRRVLVVFTAKWSPDLEQRLRGTGHTDAMVYDPSGTGVFPPAMDVYTDMLELKERVSTYRPYDTVQVLCQKEAEVEHSDAYERQKAELEGTSFSRQIRFNTLVKRFHVIVHAFARNLRRLSKHPFWNKVAEGQPLKGVPVFIVSAGPSLDVNGPLLSEANKKGCVISVNSSAPAVAYHGALSDLMVTIEGLDLHDLFEGIRNVRAAAYCLSSNPSNYTLNCPTVLFCSTVQAFADTVSRFGYKGLDYGSSVATAAVVLAKELGATEIILVGQDLAFTGNRVYAKGSGRDVTVEVTEKTITRSDIAEQTARFKKGGLDLAEATRERLDVPAWGGAGTVITTADMETFKQWFEFFAATNEGLSLINATEGGASIGGWEEVTLKDILSDLPEISHGLVAAIESHTPIDVHVVKQFVAFEDLGATRARLCAQRALRVLASPKGSDALASVYTLVSKHPLIEAIASPDVAALESVIMPEYQKNKLKLRLITKACDKMRALLSQP